MASLTSSPCRKFFELASPSRGGSPKRTLDKIGAAASLSRNGSPSRISFFNFGQTRVQPIAPAMPSKPTKPCSIPGLTPRPSLTVLMSDSASGDRVNNFDDPHNPPKERVPRREFVSGDVNFSRNVNNIFTNPGASISAKSPMSDDNNSPTEMNSSKRICDKPAIFKRLLMGLTDEERCPLVVASTSPSPTPTRRQYGTTSSSLFRSPEKWGLLYYKDEEKRSKINSGLRSLRSRSAGRKSRDSSSERKWNPPSSDTCREGQVILDTKNKRASLKFRTISSLDIFHKRPSWDMFKSNPCSRSNTPDPALDDPLAVRGSRRRNDTSSATKNHQQGSPPAVPPVSLRHQNRFISGSCESDFVNCAEAAELRSAPWFQAGIPREIALEILNSKPVGNFLVRESLTKPGCFALSLRVPYSHHQTGMAHYLILRTSKGFKIKGFTKEFSSLSALIVHHSVMKELLPCPLLLPRRQPNPVNSYHLDHDNCNDYEDTRDVTKEAVVTTTDDEDRMIINIKDGMKHEIDLDDEEIGREAEKEANYRMIAELRKMMENLSAK